MKTATVPALDVSPESNLSRYLLHIRSYPMLEAEEEYRLAVRWCVDQDDQACHTLANSHLRLVAKIAMGFKGYGLPIAELISEGNVGLMQALRRFDPERGFRLSTYAMWWIRASIQEYILHSWSLVKMGTTAAQKKLFFNLRKLKNQLHSIDHGDLTPDHVHIIASRLNVSENEVVQMNRRLGSMDQSLNAPFHDDSGSEWLDILEDEQQNQETEIAHLEELDHRRKMLTSALEILSERERNIVRERRLNEYPATLQKLSDKYGISRERIRQIEVGAFKKLKKSVRNAAYLQSKPEHEARP